MIEYDWRTRVDIKGHPTRMEPCVRTKIGIQRHFFCVAATDLMHCELFRMYGNVEFSFQRAGRSVTIQGFAWSSRE